MYTSGLNYVSNLAPAGAHVFQVRDQPSPISPVEVERLLQRRCERMRLFPDGLFADPAWDMLLHLYATELSGARTSVKAVVRASHVPSTTGHRWLNTLIRRGLCEKTPDFTDARRQYVTLTDFGRSAMDTYFRLFRLHQEESVRYVA